MADEQYRWLDRETAERLLRGESPDAVGAAARDQAERLAEALGALAATPPLTSEELPGEAAALAAFRKARAERDAHPAALADPARTRPSDAGLFRIGARADGRTADGARPRRGRPLRLALAATLAVGMVGGVAFAAGTGVLPTPFDDTEPRPAASVSAAATPDRPLLTPSPDGTHGGAGSAEPGAGAASGEPGEGGTETDRDSGDRATPSGGSGRSWSEIASACRAVRDGRGLDADRRRVLEGAAGGSSRVGRYCENVLRGTGGAASGGSTGGSLAGSTGGALAGTTGSGQGQGKGGNDAGGKGSDGKGEDGKGEDGKGDDDGPGIGRPGGNGHGGNGHDGAGAGQDSSGREDRHGLQDPERRQDSQDSLGPEDSQGRVSPAPQPQPSLTPPYTTR